MSVLLSFHDVLLYTEDLLALQPPHWITDKIIEFHFTWLQLLDPSSYFVPPSLSFLLSSTSLSVAGLVPDALLRRQKLFFALTDAVPEEGGGGTHWALLVVTQDKAFVVDSMMDGWRKEKEKKMREEKEIEKKEIVSSSSSSPTFRAALAILKNLLLIRSLQLLPCPQQFNSFDCGVYLCWFAESFLNGPLTHPPSNYRETIRSRILHQIQ